MPGGIWRMSLIFAAWPDRGPALRCTGRCAVNLVDFFSLGRSAAGIAISRPAWANHFHFLSLGRSRPTFWYKLLLTDVYGRQRLKRPGFEKGDRPEGMKKWCWIVIGCHITKWVNSIFFWSKSPGSHDKFTMRRGLEKRWIKQCARKREL
jgi:hypothetical protein